MYKIRFNRGKVRPKWKITDYHGRVELYDVEEYGILMSSCKLVNLPDKAQKVFQGGTKKDVKDRVCAWIECDHFTVFRLENLNRDSIKGLTELFYNPRKQPYWLDSSGKNIDGSTYFRLLGLDKKIFAF